ncbi:MAG: hydantoinase/oxoprolinase family protein [Anaerolineales bacterium]|jgi:probable H4MPT-linked C1 transfer pathway protein
MPGILGWDIGGANIKAAWLPYASAAPGAIQTASRPFEIWHGVDRLQNVLKDLAAGVAREAPQAMALTLTAELADVFGTKRQGVLFVLQSVTGAFPDCPCFVLSLSGEFVSVAQAQLAPLDFAASNWVATARYLSRQFPDCVMVDVGSTTTDIIPILAGKLCNRGKTDLDRLIAGELVYTGLLRTHLASIVHAVPVRGQNCPVSSEYFAISGDVHLVLGNIQPSDYDCPTPDGRPPSLATARARLARLVCADTEMLSPDAIDAIATDIYQQQLGQIGRALSQVRSHLPGSREIPVVALGSGAFIAAEVARRLGLPLTNLAETWGRQAARVAPSLAAAHLLAEEWEHL